jgi:hypothetical protein
MRIARFLLLLLCFAIPSVASAADRVALVIGNASYAHVPQLPNARNDAEAMAELFRKAGFSVQLRHDLRIAELRQALRDFSQMAQAAEVAAVFFSGHGIEMNGTNFLIPVDARLARDIDVEDETISLDRLMRTLEGTKRLKLAILDACRDNPFAKTMKRLSPTRSIGRGLARVEPATTDTLVAYAAKAGSTAADGQGQHSPYTAALMKHLPTPGLDLRIALGRVRDEVLLNTERKQEPFVYGSLGGTVTSLVPAAARPSKRAARPPQQFANQSLSIVVLEERTGQDPVKMPPRLYRTITLDVRANGAITMRHLARLPNKSPFGSWRHTGRLDASHSRVEWEARSGSLLGTVRFVGFVWKATVRVAEGSCKADVVYERHDGEANFILIHTRTKERHFASAMRAVSVSCQMKPLTP